MIRRDSGTMWQVKREETSNLHEFKSLQKIVLIKVSYDRDFKTEDDESASNVLISSADQESEYSEHSEMKKPYRYSNSSNDGQIESDEDIKPMICGKCGSAFEMQKYKARSHSNQLIKQAPLCLDCAKAKADEGRTRSENVNRFICYNCGKVYKTRGTLAIHIQKSHIGSCHFMCPECGKVFESNDDLSSHLQIHSEGKPHACSECGYAFKTRESLNRHFLGCHASCGPLLCPECGRLFKSKIHLLHHQRVVHQNKKSYHCWHCNKIFETRQAITKHVAIHVTEQSCYCNVCGKQCKSKIALSKHIQTHNMELSHSCPKCKSCFRTKDCLRHHLERVHTGEAYHYCLECGKGYKSKSLLSQHIRTHSGERPYSCPECGWAFKVKADLKKHILRHLRDGNFNLMLEHILLKGLCPPIDTDACKGDQKEQNYCCTHCEKEFRTIPDIITHIYVDECKQTLY